MLIPEIGGRFIITKKSCAPQPRNEDFKHYTLKNQGYFVIRTDSEEWTIWVVPESQ